MERLGVDTIMKLNELKSELEYEKAISIYGRLRWMAKEDNSLLPVKHRLKELIKKYENEHWEDEAKITPQQISESDIAEKRVELENLFIQKRKELIRQKLKEHGLSQQDLAKLLGHRPNYMSALMNGVRPFSRDDILVIHKLFAIDLKDLMPPFLKTKVTSHIRKTLEELKQKNAGVKLRLTDPATK